MSKEIVPQVFDSKEFGSIRAMRGEDGAGRLRFVMPNGATKGYRIAVSEMDRWMEASQR